MFIGFLVLVAGYAFQVTESIIASSYSSPLYGNAGTVLQLIGTTFVIVGIVMLAIGFLKFIRRRFFSPMRT
jgi:Na+-translocating ferredoxin:NAD+ oxidoreductase RnfA subunit